MYTFVPTNCWVLFFHNQKSLLHHWDWNPGTGQLESCALVRDENKFQFVSASYSTKGSVEKKEKKSFKVHGIKN